MPLPLSLPTVQNWSCHSCGGCCQEDQIILVTEKERERILSQNWTAADGVPDVAKAFRRVGWGEDGRRLYRLGHQANGSCVFLDENNRCRIHARYGEPAKPLPCRVYPFVFHPAGQSIAVSMRFACPSVANNSGAPVEQQRKDLLALRDLVVPAGASDRPPPLIWGSQQLDWPDTLRIVRRLGNMLASDGPSLATRLVHALWVAGMLGQANFDKVRGSRVDDLLDVLVQAAPLETVESAQQLPSPTKLGQAQFRLVVAQYAGRYSREARSIAYRIGRAMAGFRFVCGWGRTPVMQPGLRPVRFADIGQVSGGAAPEIDRLLQRYYEVKLAGMAFCGPAFYGLGVVEGFQSLAMVYPIFMYIARWIALGDGRTAVTAGDAERAVSIVDYHHGYSPAMGGRAFRHRVRLMARQDQIGKLVGWFGR